MTLYEITFPPTLYFIAVVSILQNAMKYKTYSQVLIKLYDCCRLEIVTYTRHNKKSQLGCFYSDVDFFVK